MAARIDEALRVTGRLVAFAGGAAALFFVFGVMLKPFFPSGLPFGQDGRMLYEVLLVIALFVAQVVVLFALDRGRWALAGLGEGAWAPAALALGLALGIAVQGASALAMAFTGVVEPAGVAWSWPTGSVLLLGVAGTLVDAFLLRGYVIGLVAARAGQVTAVAVTMLVAVVMAASGGSPTLMDAATAAATAAFLGALRLRTGSLAAAWLAHLAIETIADGMGGDALPAVTAGLLALVSFLLFVLRPRTDGPGRA